MDIDLFILVREAYSNSLKTMCLRATPKLVFSKLKISYQICSTCGRYPCAFQVTVVTQMDHSVHYHAFRKHYTITMHMYFKEIRKSR